MYWSASAAGTQAENRNRKNSHAIKAMENGFINQFTNRAEQVASDAVLGQRLKIWAGTEPVDRERSVRATSTFPALNVAQ